MNKAVKDGFEDNNWYKDRYQYVLVQRKLLAVITLMSLICTLATVIVISQLSPLKTIEPFVIQVDQKSGITETVDPLTVKELTANEAVNNFFIVQYIRAREDFSMSDVTRNYNLVRLMSESGTVQIQSDHAESLERYGVAHLRLGDVVAIRDYDTRWGPGYRKAAATIGVVSHGDSPKAGHGPGVTPLLTAIEGGIQTSLVKERNIADLLGVRQS